jgi:hypothetical protein
MTEILSNKDVGEAFIKRIRDRLHKQNKNWLCLICGQTGSGKSYSAISLAQQITKGGNKYKVVFNPDDFRKTLMSDDLKRGDVIIFDEAGVGMASREWYSEQNKLLGKVLQTFRVLNIGVIFTTPVISFIDVQARSLFHNYLFTEKINFKSRTAYIKVLDVNNNSYTGKIYYTAPSFYDKERGVYIRMSSLGVPYPDNTRQQIDLYEKEKIGFTKNVIKDDKLVVNDYAIPIINTKNVNLKVSKSYLSELGL